MSRRDSIKWYFGEIEKIPLLSKDQEKELFKKIKKGDIEARNKLVAANLRFVVMIANRYNKTGVSIHDIISEGNLGLIEATEHFNPESGLKFISYGVWWIRQRIFKMMNERAKPIRIPANKALYYLKIDKIEQELNAKMGRQPTSEEIANVLNTTGKEVEFIQNLLNIVSLDSSLNEGNSSATLVDRIIDDNQLSLSESTERSHVSDIINDLFKYLSEQEKIILEHRFGINGKPKKSLEATGKIFNLTKERIRQIEKKSLMKLIKHCEEKDLRIFIEV